jgi:hypothetical protein
VECKLRWIDFRRELDPRRAIWPAFGVTGSDCNRIGNSSGRWRELWVSLRTPGSAGDEPGSNDNKFQSTGNNSGRTSNDSRIVRENQHLHSKYFWYAWKS